MFGKGLCLHCPKYQSHSCLEYLQISLLKMSEELDLGGCYNVLIHTKIFLIVVNKLVCPTRLNYLTRPMPIAILYNIRQTPVDELSLLDEILMRQITNAMLYDISAALRVSRPVNIV